MAPRPASGLRTQDLSCCTASSWPSGHLSPSRFPCLVLRRQRRLFVDKTSKNLDRELRARVEGSAIHRKAERSLCSEWTKESFVSQWAKKLSGRMPRLMSAGYWGGPSETTLGWSRNSHYRQLSGFPVTEIILFLSTIFPPTECAELLTHINFLQNYLPSCEIFCLKVQTRANNTKFSEVVLKKPLYLWQWTDHHNRWYSTNLEEIGTQEDPSPPFKHHLHHSQGACI